MDNYDTEYAEFLKEWEKKIADEYLKEGIIVKDGRYYKDGKEIFILDDRDPIFEWAKRQTA